MNEARETSNYDRFFTEIIRVYDDREKAEKLLKDAGYPASRIPSNCHTLLDFWERVRHEIRAGIISGGLWPILARAHEMYPDNGVFKPSQGPKKIFISYRTNAALDKRVCETLDQHLSRAGHDVFFDRKIEVGTTWVRKIESEIHSADAMILLLTKDSCLSEMFLREIELARRVADARQGLPRLLPVRVAFNDALPYPLSGSIGSLQYARWDSDDDTGRLLEAIESSLRNDIGALSNSPPGTSELSLGLRPLPQAQIYNGMGGRTGTLSTDDSFYVERKTDAKGLGAIRSGPGVTISIKGSRQLGKSSLFVRLLDAALQAGRRAVYLDFQVLSGTWESSSAFFQYFASAIAQELDLPGHADDAWSAHSPANSCTRFIETHVLGRLNSPLTLACDEVDVVMKYPFQNEFFSMLRSWHNRRARPAKGGANPWGSLDILLVTSTEPYLFIKGSEQSPFNVGTVLSLEDFTLDEFRQLNERFDSPLETREDLKQIYDLLGGQPYLSRRALHLLSPGGDEMRLSALLARAHDGQGPFGDHLRMLLSKIVSNDSGGHELTTAFKAVLEGSTDPTRKHELSLLYLTSLGILRRTDEGFVPRCGLYTKYFRERLGRHG